MSRTRNRKNFSSMAGARGIPMITRRFIPGLKRNLRRVVNRKR